MTKIHRTVKFRVNYNEYQHAYLTVVSKYYLFCFRLLAEWVYYIVKDLPENERKNLLNTLNFEIRRNKFDTLKTFDFPARLYLTVYKRLPSSIAQNIWPEVLATIHSALKTKPERINVSFFRFHMDEYWQKETRTYFPEK